MEKVRVAHLCLIKLSHSIMFAEFAKSALEFIKLAPRYLVSIALITGVLLFISETWIERIGLDALVKSYRQWLGLTFLVSTTLWGIAIFSMFWNWINDKLFQRNVEQKIIQRLNSLTEDEKQILRYYLAKNTRANVLRIDDGVVNGLVENLIIYRSASMGHIVDGFSHNITDFAWNYLHTYPQVLKGTTNYYRTDKQERRRLY